MLNKLEHCVMYNKACCNNLQEIALKKSSFYVMTATHLKKKKKRCKQGHVYLCEALLLITACKSLGAEESFGKNDAPFLSDVKFELFNTLGSSLPHVLFHVMPNVFN